MKKKKKTARDEKQVIEINIDKGKNRHNKKKKRNVNHEQKIVKKHGQNKSKKKTS